MVVELRLHPLSLLLIVEVPGEGQAISQEGRCPTKAASTLLLEPGNSRSQEWKSYVHLTSQGAEALSLEEGNYPHFPFLPPG